MARSTDPPFTIVLAFDGDKPGQDAGLRNGAKLDAYITASNAWHLENWDQFDQLPVETQAKAWQILSDQAREHSDALAKHEGIVDRPLTPPRRRAPQRTWKPAKIPHHGRDLDSIQTEEYVQVLAGQEVQLRRGAPCPFPNHEDSSPSFYAYEDGHFNCFGCNRGGRIFDFAAALWGVNPPLRGDTFREIRDRLHDHLG